MTLEGQISRSKYAETPPCRDMKMSSETEKSHVFRLE